MYEESYNDGNLDENYDYVVVQLENGAKYYSDIDYYIFRPYDEDLIK